MKIKTISFEEFSWTSSKMENRELQKIYNTVEGININSLCQHDTKERGTVVFFCMEKRDTLDTFINLNCNLKYNEERIVYFPYSHLSSLPLNFKESCLLFREISEYLKQQNKETIIAPFYFHKPYVLVTTSQPLIHFYDSEGKIEELDQEIDKKSSLTGNVYLDDISSPKESIKGSYFKGSIAVSIESIIEKKYKNLLLKTLSYVREVESPLLYNYEGKLAKHYLKKFPARQFYLRNNNKEYFLRIATCHGVFSRLSEIKDLKIPIGYYEKGSCFRKEQAGEIKRGERYSSFTMPDCHLIVPRQEAEYYFNKVRDLLSNFYENLLFLPYKAILRSTGSLTDTSFWSEVDKIKNQNYFCEKGEFEVSGVQLATVQIDYENALVYFKGKDLAIIHFTPGSLERIANMISQNKENLSKIVPTYYVTIGLVENILNLSNNIYISTKKELPRIIQSIIDPIYNLIVIGNYERESGVVRKVLRLRDQKGPIYSQDLLIDEVNRTRTDVFNSQS